jgi:adenylate cyclase
MRQGFQRYLPYLTGLALLLLFVLQSLRWVDLPLIDHVRRGYYDWRLRVTTPNRNDDRIVIVDIDEKSLAELGRWPWPRDRVAKLIDILFEHYHIRLMGLDMVFAEADESSGWPLMKRLSTQEMRQDKLFQKMLESLRPSLQFDETLARALRGRAVVLGFVTRNEDGSADVGALPKALLSREQIPTVLNRLLKPERYTGNLSVLQTAALSGGYFGNPLLDEDGVFRHLPLLIRSGDGIYEAMSLALFRAMQDFPPVEFEIGEEYGDSEEEQRLEALHIGTRRIPTGERGDVLIPYLGRQGSFRYIPVGEALRKTIPTKALRDRIVLLGTTANGLMDARTTPLQASFPGVEIHANVLAAMLDGRFLEKPSWVAGLELVQLLLVGLAMIVWAPRLSAAWGSVLNFSLMGLLLAANVWFWSEAMIVVDAVLPLLLLFLLYANQMFFGFFLESHKKRKLTRLFGQYVPEELVNQMSRSGQDFGIGGEAREMTVLFSDVRNFTSMSEGLAPEELSSLMNEFLTPLTAAIHQYRGTIDKYMGDAIMAFWGAPLRDPEQATHAVRAAMEMVRRVEAIHAAFALKGWPAIRIGVGLNTGMMSVGNMGSEFRMAYTVLGDAVNLGSRLEGLTKQYGVDILISAATRAAASGLVCREIDRVRVKGKNEPVAIYEPLGWTGELPAATLTALERHEQALTHYRAQHWDAAETIFNELLELEPLRAIYSVYLKRIADFRNNPPPGEWDGVYAHLSK